VPARHYLTDQVEAAIRAAVPDCRHHDPAAPVYDPTRPCPSCAARAVVALFPVIRTTAVDVDTHDALRGRYIVLTGHTTPDPQENIHA
jgi:hypothetical protein